ncbi:MAG TPA: GNAT family N-acetyltransferase [Terracidiphilus sp.]|nr:GNAT family N-acetyltransferase [Terracidiphilus sp.]
MLLRPAEPKDAMAVAIVHVRSWQAAYRGLLPDAYLDNLRAEDRAERYDFTHSDPANPHTIVAVESDSILGFATTRPCPDDDRADYGELAALYVDPDYWHRGLGVALVSAARVRLAELGFMKAVLWVLEGNQRAEKFYLNDGWTRNGIERSATMWGIQLHEVRFQRNLVAS